MTAETLEVAVPEPLLRQIDSACESGEYADRDEVVAAAISRAADGRNG